MLVPTNVSDWHIELTAIPPIVSCPSLSPKMNECSVALSEYMNCALTFSSTCKLVTMRLRIAMVCCLLSAGDNASTPVLMYMLVGAIFCPATIATLPVACENIAGIYGRVAFCWIASKLASPLFPSINVMSPVITILLGVAAVSLVGVAHGRNMLVSPPQPLVAGALLSFF